MEDQKSALPQAQQGSRGADSKIRWGYAIPFAIAVAVLAWAYFDKYSRNQDDQMARLKVGIQKLADQKVGPFAVQTSEEGATAEGGMTTYSAALGDHRFQVDLPAGYHLSVSADATGEASAYVLLDPTKENETSVPDMVISLVDIKSEPHASKLRKEEPGTRLVPTTEGKFAFWIRGWEDLAWPEFDKVAASFKAL